MADTRPLLLLTRPNAASQAFWEALPEDMRSSVDLMINPLISIHPKGEVPSLDGVTRLIFTSANGAQAFADLGGHPNAVPAITVGENTAIAARDLGFDVEVAGGNAERLIDHILASGIPGPMLHLRGEVSLGDIAERLTAGGVTTREAILYEQRLEPLKEPAKAALSQDRVVIAPVFSPRTARQLMDESGRRGALSYAAISPAVAEALTSAGASDIRTAKSPNRAGMVDLVAEMISDAVALERPIREM